MAQPSPDASFCVSALTGSPTKILKNPNNADGWARPSTLNSTSLGEIPHDWFPSQTPGLTASLKNLHASTESPIMNTKNRPNTRAMLCVVALGTSALLACSKSGLVAGSGGRAPKDKPDSSTTTKMNHAPEDDAGISEPRMITGTWLSCQKNKSPGKLELACQLRSVDTGQTVPEEQHELDWRVEGVPSGVRVEQRPGPPPWQQVFVFSGGESLLREIADVIIKVVGTRVTSEQRVERLLETAVDATRPESLGGGPTTTLPGFVGNTTGITVTTRVLNTVTTSPWPTSPTPRPQSAPFTSTTGLAPGQLPSPTQPLLPALPPRDAQLQLQDDGQLVARLGGSLASARLEGALVTSEVLPTQGQQDAVPPKDTLEMSIEIKAMLHATQAGLPCSTPVQLSANAPLQVACVGGSP